MNVSNDMTTLTEVLERLRQKKIDNEFRWSEEGFSAGRGKFYQPQEMEIIKVYRFEGDSDPADMSILYIIRAVDGLTGYSLDSYGAYSDHDHEEGYNNFIRQIPESGHDEQLLFEL